MRVFIAPYFRRVYRYHTSEFIALEGSTFNEEIRVYEPSAS